MHSLATLRQHRACGILLPILLLCVVPAFAQNAGGPGAERRAAIDKLLGTLKSAPSEEVAGPLENQIQQLWLNAGTPAVTLLMSRGLRELKADADPDAVEDFTDAITLDPNLAEAHTSAPSPAMPAATRQVRSPTSRRLCNTSPATLQRWKRSPISLRHARIGRVPMRRGRRFWKLIRRLPAATIV